MIAERTKATEMPTTSFMAPLREPETYALADMHGVLHDLRVVSAICNRRLRDQKDDDIGSLEVEAIEGGALVRYGRCFSGVRHAFRLGPMVEELPSSLRAAHVRFTALRDKHIAHSVNDWELNLARAHLRRDDETDMWEVYAVGVSQHRIDGLSTDDLALLGALARALVDRVECEIDVEKQRF